MQEQTILELTIIIVDDDAGHRHLIRRSLFKAGIVNETIEFEDGHGALEFLSGKKENGGRYLMLLDIRMPGIDGIEVLQRIKNDEKLKVIPVIMLSTTDDPAAILRCHVLGCNTYIIKPINHQDFMNSINKLGLFIRIVSIPELK